MTDTFTGARGAGTVQVVLVPPVTPPVQPLILPMVLPNLPVIVIVWGVLEDRVALPAVAASVGFSTKRPTGAAVSVP